MVSVSSYFVGIKGGLTMSLIAFSIVFIVIAGLMLMMMALKRFSSGSRKGGPGDKGAAPAQVAPVSSRTPEAPALASSGAVSSDDELVAVITAAISAMSGAGVRVASVVPVSEKRQGSPWRMMGRLQNAEGFAD